MPRSNGPSADKQNIELLVDSRLFDDVAYSVSSGHQGSRRDLATHFLTTGYDRGLPPSAGFDVKFYLETYPDVAQSGMNALVHYIRHGRDEARYASPGQLRSDARSLLQSNLFDFQSYRDRMGLLLAPNLSIAENHLLNWRSGRRLTEDFDDLFFETSYRSTERTKRPPIIDFLVRRGEDVLFTTEAQLERAVARVSVDIDVGFYLDQLPADVRSAITDQASAIRHYLLLGVNAGFKPNPRFAPQFYRDIYPDIRQHDVEPFGHYLDHGRSEGRRTSVDLSSFFRAGDVRYVPALDTILIANHDSSRTGAPLVGLNLARALEKRWNVFSFVGRAEALVEEFRVHSTGLFVGNCNNVDMAAIVADLQRNYGLKAIVTNSVEASGFIEAGVQAGVGVVALIHEFADYTAPFGRIADAVRLADRVVVPAQLVERSIQEEVEAVCGARAPNIVVQRQGALPWLPEEKIGSADGMPSKSAADITAYVTERSGSPKHIVLGAGYVSLRKGVDLFVQTAAEVAKRRDDVAFLWVGDGYNPRSDMTYSIWVEQMIKRMGMEQTVHFLPPQANLDAAFAASSAFYLPSRLDPFPNVVIDALAASVGVVCFEGATGSAELFTNEDADAFVGSAVAHCDVVAAAEALIALIDDPALADGNGEKAAVDFAFATYVAEIERVIGEARSDAAQREVVTDRIIDAGVLDLRYYQGRRQSSARAVTRDYVASSSHGLTRRNPRPGFNENLWLMREDHQLGRGAMDEALDRADDSAAPTTHKCYSLPRTVMSVENGLTPRTALHIHFHYADLAPEFFNRLVRTDVPIDIFATVNSEHGRLEVEYAFRSYDNGTVTTIEVPNRGRDVGPLLVDLAGRLGEYEIVGHLHAKRSLVIGEAAGTMWRSFLLDTLLGNSDGTLETIIDLFCADPELGLLFPEDPHNVGWTRNRPFGETLAGRLSPRPTLLDRPVFPIGTMFWARRETIEPFWNLGLTYDELPSEPLPYDGSILHAIERLIPDVCRAQGLSWATLQQSYTRR